MNTLILILLVLLWSAVMFTVGFLFCQITIKGKEIKLDSGHFSKARDKPKEDKMLTPEQERQIKILKQQMQNFATYDGSPQEDIHVE